MAKKLCALTFDDGPNTVTTPLVLEKLKKYGIPASFFLVGNNIDEASAKVVKTAFDMGCDIENHSRTHTAFTELSPEEMRAEIKFTSDKIESITGRAPRFFRPPYIAVSDKVFENVGLTFIAGIGAEDWLPEVTARERAEKIIAQIADGAVILLHDMTGNTPTVEALDFIIPRLSEEYEFVTISRLFHGVKPEKNKIYSFVKEKNE